MEGVLWSPKIDQAYIQFGDGSASKFAKKMQNLRQVSIAVRAVLPPPQIIFGQSSLSFVGVLRLCWARAWNSLPSSLNYDKISHLLKLL